MSLFDPFGFWRAVQTSWHDQRVAFWYARTDATTFLQWREPSLSQAPGVPNIPGC